MFRRLLRTARDSEGNWLIRILPGLWVTGFVIAARLLGALQPLELLALDYFLRLRPPEPPDDRIVIVEIDAEDVERMGGYPIEHQKLAEIVRSLQQYDPAVIGVNILGDLLAEEHQEELSQLFREDATLIAAEKVLPPQNSLLPDLPQQQSGFTDILPDGDNNLRRMLLGTPNPVNPDEFKFSFAIRLAEVYLEPKGYVLDNGIRDPDAMRFGPTEIPRVTPNAGVYVGVDSGGVQTLINFRGGDRPFKILSLEDIITNNVDQALLRDRIVILGVVDDFVRPPIQTRAVSNFGSNEISGLQIQAHSVSQIISSVLDERPNLKSLPEAFEYLWILIWGIFCSTVWLLDRAIQDLIIQGIGSLLLVSLSYYLVILGYVIPVILCLLIASLNLVQISIYEYTYKRPRKLNSKITERQEVIERTFSVIHNGPLQDLANLLRHLHDDNLSRQKLVDELSNLNTRIREIGDHLKIEASSSNERFRWVGSIMLDLRRPIHELFYQIYSRTASRHLIGFESLKVRIRSFDAIDESCLTSEQKLHLCLFLEEALCNAGKHGGKLTYLKAIGSYYDSWYILQIEDNGLGMHSNYEGEGTKFAIKLAKHLGGVFNRSAGKHGGTLCQLKWQPQSRRNHLVFSDFMDKMKSYCGKLMRRR
ncbi:MAG: CHASE2 domain-containing protein [Elainellaceae cyanobacterium]